MSDRSQTRDRIRASMRARRRALSQQQRNEAALRIARNAVAHRLLRPGSRIALYLAHGSEADCGALIDLAVRRGCRLYVPKITSYRRRLMEFVRYERQARIGINRHGIEEPDLRNAVQAPLRTLDLVFLPLVAFDLHGWRLGSGAGYYDRRLQPLRQGRRWRRPKLVGVAYEFQRVAEIAPARWDVPMDAVLTEVTLHRTQRPARGNEHEERQPAVNEDP